MHQLGLPRLLAEMPLWATGLGFVAAIIGGVVVSRLFAAREAFADSYVTMGVLGFAGLITLGSLVPGLFFDLDSGARFLLGLGLFVIGLGGWMASREMLKGRLVAVLCLLFVAVAGVVFWQFPQWYFDSGNGTRALLLISSTFVVPLSVGRLVATTLRMEDLSFRLGVVLTAITLALWPMAKELVVRGGNEWKHEEAVRKWEEGSESYPVTVEAKQVLEKKRPGLTVHYLADGKSRDEARSSGRLGAAEEGATRTPDAADAADKE